MVHVKYELPVINISDPYVTIMTYLSYYLVLFWTGYLYITVIGTTANLCITKLTLTKLRTGTYYQIRKLYYCIYYSKQCPFSKNTARTILMCELNIKTRRKLYHFYSSVSFIHQYVNIVLRNHNFYRIIIITTVLVPASQQNRYRYSTVVEYIYFTTTITNGTSTSTNLQYY